MLCWPLACNASLINNFYWVLFTWIERLYVDKNISSRLSHNFLEFKFEDKDTSSTTFFLVIKVSIENEIRICCSWIRRNTWKLCSRNLLWDNMYFHHEKKNKIVCISKGWKLSASPRVGTLLYTITCNYPNLCHVLQFSMLSYNT